MVSTSDSDSGNLGSIPGTTWQRLAATSVPFAVGNTFNTFNPSTGFCHAAPEGASRRRINCPVCKEKRIFDRSRNKRSSLMNTWTGIKRFLFKSRDACKYKQKKRPNPLTLSFVTSHLAGEHTGARNRVASEAIVCFAIRI
jgi:hypothetical protein